MFYFNFLGIFLDILSESNVNVSDPSDQLKDLRKLKCQSLSFWHICLLFVFVYIFLYFSSYKADIVVAFAITVCLYLASNIPL